MSKFQKKVLMGTILGDGGLKIPSTHVNARLRIGQKLSNKNYLFWKYGVLKEWFLKPPYIDEERLYRAQSISHPILTEIYNLFYPKGDKIIPRNITELFESPISLAVWYMDDGTKLKDRGVYFSTQSFTLEDHQKLIDLLEENFGLSSNFHQQNQKEGSYYRLYVPKSDFEKLKAIVESYVLPSFRYKLRN